MCVCVRASETVAMRGRQSERASKQNELATQACSPKAHFTLVLLLCFRLHRVPAAGTMMMKWAAKAGPEVKVVASANIAKFNSAKATAAVSTTQ